jgi:hypothetical protein
MNSDMDPRVPTPQEIETAVRNLNRKARRKLWAELRGKKVDRRNWRKR